MTENEQAMWDQIYRKVGDDFRQIDKALRWLKLILEAWRLYRSLEQLQKDTPLTRDEPNRWFRLSHLKWVAFYRHARRLDKASKELL